MIFNKCVLEALICLLNVELAKSKNEFEMQYIQSTKKMLQELIFKMGFQDE